LFTFLLSEKRKNNMGQNILLVVITFFTLLAFYLVMKELFKK